MNINNFITVLIGVLFTIPAWAQQQVSGTVKDTGGAPIAGVTVSIKGTTRGTTTSDQGSFHFSNVQGDDILVFSSLGFLRKEEPISGRLTIHVVLDVDDIHLQEAVIGYDVAQQMSLTDLWVAVTV